MNTELEGIPADAEQSVTKGDLYALEQRTSRKFDAMRELIKSTAAETRDHFEVIAENIHKDVGGANQDEITSLRDKIEEHEARLKSLEPSF